MRWIWLSVSALCVLAACVTINVYFPAAAAEEAADQFIDEIIGKDAAASGGGGWALNLSLISSAQAQANIDIDTPAIRAIQARMSGRFEQTLKAQFDAGAIGLTHDGRVEVRDASAIPLSQRSAVNAAVAEDNRDRDAVYREIAVANGHPEWEGEIRDTFARRWLDRAHSGWYYRNASGQWQRKS
ncbi:MAG: YdbL family protein [Xanthomonadales bacterium]|nr:YdbL family protein [Xanthomonadales bacterium]MCB1634915.1 YdbL family protein [Xanthomonadales bacterium]MCB1641011.1 YdbL family protein [Xanthomonadales bacterium]